MSLGVHFALSTEDEARLLAAAGDDDAVIDLVEGIEEGGTSPLHCDTDKAWTPCTGASPTESSSTPEAATARGRPRWPALVEEVEYIASYVSAERCATWRRRCPSSRSTGCAGGTTPSATPTTPGRSTRTTSSTRSSEDVREFRHGGGGGRAVIFTVDA
jgi:hypothetical protein